MTPDLRVETLTGDALAAALGDVARLRIAVFREWPYLYDGDLDYEATYLEAYTKTGALCVAVYDDGEMIGASTGAPLADHADGFWETLPADKVLKEVFYCAESVLLPGYRGRGLGHVFFDRREAHARELGFTDSVFASVIRPKDHPARPDAYRPLDPFWRKRGYAPLEGAVARFDWKDVGESEDSTKPLQLWGRAL